MYTNFLLASPQSSGKSYLVDKLAAKYAKRGKRILIACPTGELAMEHKERIEAQGQRAFVLMSHKNLFEKFKPGFICPYFDEIQTASKLGAGTSYSKNKFCSSCDQKKICPFPDQYSNLKDDKNTVIICQHAHFTSPDVVRQLLDKRFDVLFVDESFISNLIINVKPTEIELEILKSHIEAFPWVEKLYNWLNNGGYPQGRINPDIGQMESLINSFENRGVSWRLPDYVRLFKGGHLMDKAVGLDLFYPLPNIPIRIFTDATPPKEMLEIVLDAKIKTIGSRETLDPSTKNPNNKITQVLDGSCSKSSLRGEMLEDGSYSYDRFYQILTYIGDQAKSVYKEKKILLTTYKTEFKQIAEDFFQVNYPEIVERLLISHMAIGTNAYDEFDVQYIVCGVYFNALQLAKQVYSLKVIANYWNMEKSRRIIQNPYPYGVVETSGIERIEIPIKRLKKVGTKAKVKILKGFKQWVPLDFYQRIIHNLGISKTQQAIRILRESKREKHVVLFFNSFLSGFPIDENVLEVDLLGYLRE